jgi:hypothetical protein
MYRFPTYTLKSAVAQEMYRRAKHCYYEGTSSPEDKRAISHCTATWTDGHVGVIMIFTRDVGLHTGGMLKNPDYERCYHLSLSFRDTLTGKYIPFDKAEAKAFVEAFYSPDDVKKLWVESPKSPEGKESDVWHYRLLCDEQWNGIVPRKEVYSSEFTELDWKSFSEIHGAPPLIMPGFGPA